MNNNVILIALDQVYERIKCQQFVSEKVLSELADAVDKFEDVYDSGLVERWLFYIKNVSQDALMLKNDKNKAHFSLAHDTLCDLLLSYLTTAIGLTSH